MDIGRKCKGVIVDKKIADYFDDHKLMCGLTYSGHPLACAAGIATLDVYKEEKLVERSKAMGKILGQIEEELKRKHHGRNYWGVKEKGFSTYSHENNIIVAPPLIITEIELRDAMAIMDEVLADVDAMI